MASLTKALINFASSKVPMLLKEQACLCNFIVPEKYSTNESHRSEKLGNKSSRHPTIYSGRGCIEELSLTEKFNSCTASTCCNEGMIFILFIHRRWYEGIFHGVWLLVPLHIPFWLKAFSRNVLQSYHWTMTDAFQSRINDKISRQPPVLQCLFFHLL